MQLFIHTGLMTGDTATHTGCQGGEKKDNRKRRIQPLLMFPWKQQGRRIEGRVLDWLVLILIVSWL